MSTVYKMKYPRIILAGAHSGVGKTTIACGIMLALKKKGLKVQPFKAGPDYIDPSYHTDATGIVSRNLDSWLLSKGAILELFKKHAGGTDISIIEGVMGLYDGLQNTEVGSTAHLAKLLKSPVILILDARSLSRSAGAVVLGYRDFDKNLMLKAVILNNIASASHYYYVKTSIEKKTGIPVLGYLPKNPELKLPQRHLGLVPTPERKLGSSFHKELLRLIEKYIDIGAIIKLSAQAQPLPDSKAEIFVPQDLQGRVTIAVAKDEAFNFYYQDNLDILEHLGARLVKFSPLRDRSLPEDIDGVYIGGGFPELFAHRLSRNTRLRKEIYEHAQEGLPIYAECAGLMYLVEKIIDFKKRPFPMVGVFKGSVAMANRLQALGYVNVKTTQDNILSENKTRFRAHIFHWSYLDGMAKGTNFAYELSKPKMRHRDGLIKKNILASYAHVHFASSISLARNFISRCRQYKRGNTGVIVLGHGSKLKKANNTISRVINMIKKRLSLSFIAPAYLQFAQPDLSTSIKKLVNKGCKRIITVPFFLFMGNHVSRDIPNALRKEKARYPSIDFIYTENLGDDPRIAEVVTEKIEEKLK